MSESGGSDQTAPSAVDRYERSYASVEGLSMAYVDAGRGRPIVFVHGNPTSSYLWRNVIPHLEGLGRCLAPDLIGMGASAKLDASDPDRYRFTEHRRFLDGLLAQLGITEDVTFVAHDWGTALVFDWARRHPGSVRGIAYLEGIVMPLRWEDWPEAARPIFQAMRSPTGEDLVLEHNVFVERILPRSVLRRLGDEEMAVYRGPYEEPGESRRPTLAWPRQIPMDGEPAEVCEIVASYSRFLAESPIPKLFVNADPGSILVGAAREHCRSFRNQREVTVAGSHFLQEDSPHEIGRALAAWVAELP